VDGTLLEHAPPGSHPVLHIVFSGESAFQPVIADLASRFALRPNILHGHVEYVQGRPLGVLTLLAEGGAGMMPMVLAYLASLNLQAKVIGHVLRDRAAAA
jgi:D-methionine transport system ATP-binding protein